MKGLYGRLIDNHPLANIAFLIVLLGGIASYLSLPRAQDPEINFNWVSIITALPGASAEDVERELTGPLEDAIKQVKDIRFVSSSSREAVSSILVRFEEISERQFDKRANDLRREIQNKASAELPPDATDPQVVEITSSNGFPTAILVLHGAAGEALRAQAFALKREIEGLAGVDQVIAAGFDEPELHVDFDPAQLAAAGLSPMQLADGVATWFRNTLGGRIRVQDREWLARLEGKTPDPEQLAQAAIITPQGRVALDEVAQVARGHDRSGQLVSYNGEPAVMLSITKQARTNTLQLVERLQAHAAQRNILLGAQGMRLTLVDDQTHATRSAISIMESNAVFGLLAVLATCWLFLGSRLALLVGLGVPFALAGTFIAVDLVGNTLNLTVLLGVVIALGMLVDDAVVVVESIYYRVQRGELARNAVINGISEVGLPVLASVLTTIAAFLPLMLLPGILGDFMFIVPFVVTVGLLVSLLEAYWIMPTHILTLGLDNRRSRLQPWRERFTRKVRVKYARLLVAVMRRPKAGMAVLMLVMAAAGGALASGMVRLEFFAFDPIRLFYVSVDMPAGVTLERSLDEAQRAVRVVEEALPASELRAVAAYSGLKFSDTEPVYGDQYAQVLVSLLPRADGMRDTGDIIAALRPHIEALNGEGRFSFLELKGGPPTARPISVKVKSDDYPQLRAASDAMLAEVARLPGAKDITDDDVPGRNELRLVLNREKLARAGVTPG